MPNDAFTHQAIVVLTTGLKLKDEMIKKRLTLMRVDCPFCAHEGFKTPGKLGLGLVGRKQHLHMACDQCPTRMME